MIANEKKFEEIVAEYSEPLYLYIRRLVVSHEDAQDILQDTLLKAFRHLWQLRDYAYLKSWLYRIATNQVNDFFKKRPQFEDLNENLCTTLLEGPYVDYTKEAEIKLQKAILTLSPQQRSVFCLKYYDDMDYDQIAKIVGAKPETLKVSYHYAKDKIKKYLDEH